MSKMTDANESEPLISSTSSSLGGKQKLSYRATLSEKQSVKNAAESGASIRMDPIIDSTTNHVLHGDQITYTWSEVDVYTSAKTDRFWERFLFRGRRHVQQKHIVKNVSGIAYPNELLVIMGSSGAGKTTLLNALTFRSSPGVTVSGTMAANGQKVTSDVLTSKIAYVQQDDLFIGTLTVKEHLMFQALVRMDRHITYRQRVQRVQQVITELSLTKCQDTVIGIPGRLAGVSGGEAKRLSFASEIITDPPLMFCDEPTSGLDSFMAHQVVSVLKTLAANGKTVVATLHQPSSELFALFDRILLMADGRIAFMGNADQAIIFFKTLGAVCPRNYNPADYFIQVLAVVPGREASCHHSIHAVCDAFERSELGLDIVNKAMYIRGNFENSCDGVSNQRISKYKATWCEQFRAVLWRSWLSVIKEPILIKVRFLQTVMVSLLIGIMYIQQNNDQDGVMNINGVLYIFLTNMTFQNIYAVVNVFCTELPVFLKENRNGMYRTDVYFICKTLAESPIFIVVPVLFTIAAYPLIGLYPSVPHFFITTGIVILVTNVATSFGYLISCVSTSLPMALAIGPPILIPFLLFGGYLLNTASVPAYFKWCTYLSWFLYGYEALLINQWADVETIQCTRSNTTCPKSGHTVLQTFNFSEDHLWFDIVGLVSLIILFRFAAFLALSSKTLR